jgi:hypothetical protein
MLACFLTIQASDGFLKSLLCIMVTSADEFPGGRIEEIDTHECIPTKEYRQLLIRET